MAQFRPFRGLTYNEPGSTPEDGVMDISAVIGATSTSELAVHRLQADPGLAMAWLRSGNLIEDAEPAFYMFRAGRRDSAGTPIQAAGVFGLGSEGPGFLLEPTMIQLNNSEVDLLLQPSGMPLVAATTADGVHFRLWPLRATGVIDTIAQAVDATGAETFGLMVATNDAVDPPPGLVFCQPQTN